MAVKRAHIGKAIRLARRSANLSQGELADAVGVHRPTVSAWEREANTPTRANVEDVARALAMTVESLELLSEEIARGEVAGAPAPRRRSGGEKASIYSARSRPRLPPRAYQAVFEHCITLEGAGVPEDLIDEARRLMSDDTFNTLNKGQTDSRTESDWMKDIEAAWVFIRDRLRAKGFRL